MEEIQDKDILLITRYFDLELSEKEMKAFDQRFQEDMEFANKVNRYQKSVNLVDNTYPNSNQEQRDEKWKQLISEDSVSTNTTTWKWIAGIAATVLILISSWYFIFPLQENNLNELAQQAWGKKAGFSDYQIRNTSESNPKQVVISAFKSYEQKDYSSTIEALENYNPSLLYYEDALLIRALAIHKMSNSKKALQLLDSLENYPTRKLSKEARWYKGLIYLDLNDLESAKKYLEIPNNNKSAIQLKQSTN
ncbi:hypothetical protein [Aquimarina sp. MMG016]|uniref:tetratricopeptide repeat protein n=1 Tax=Aquimarina sp. MMG016 TaxID=2822690 RepID=UPI001B3A2C0A|nr:hypothetical protein [Aquimarina sp. MMG016]MBQ4818910.1 hypothetical protein [Aquimarina sp. MMG016]